MTRASKMALVLITAPSRQVASKLAKTLVQERLAACVNLVPGLVSLYRWEGKMCEEVEVLLLCKTARAAFPALCRRVRQMHPYQLPEIIALPLVAGDAAYLQWLLECQAH